MANQEHLDLLKQGAEVWNQWREEHPGIQPDLIFADLNFADLGKANLRFVDLGFANLSNADLNFADLESANLCGANLNGADLSNVILENANLCGADLCGADLCGARLRGTIFRRADLSNADLSGTYLNEANLSYADLGNTDLSEAIIGWTVFGNVNLSGAKGLETVHHEGPSTIGIDTIYRSQGNIPEEFLKHAGVSDSFFEYTRSLIGKPIDYNSCFISYSSKDEAFARRLYDDLQSNQVRCWFGPEDLKIGDRIRTGIDKAILLHDKLLLILSKSSIASGWVEREVKAALAKEHKEKRTVLFPVRVDKAVFENPFDWTTEIRHERNIGDFTRWKQHDAYQRAFELLLRDLKADVNEWSPSW